MHPEFHRKGNVLLLDGIDEHPCHLMHVVARATAAHSGNQEALVGMLAGIIHEALHSLSKQEEIAGGGDGVALALGTLALTHDGTKVLHGMGGGTAGMVPLGIAAEDKDLVVGQLLNPVGSNAVRIVGSGISTMLGHFHFSAVIGIKLAAHTAKVSKLG